MFCLGVGIIIAKLCFGFFMSPLAAAAAQNPVSGRLESHAEIFGCAATRSFKAASFGNAVRAFAHKAGGQAGWLEGLVR